ncbi:MAG: hypothetical protein ACYTGP_10755 [Planctomycetota bacterium]|jgi:hypothetical protein
MRRFHLFLLGIALTLGTAAHAGDSYSVDWFTVDGGGSTLSGGPYELTGTTGQPDAGEASGGLYGVVGGFWGIMGPPAPCPGDVDGSGEVGFGDVLAIISAWGPCASCPEDLNGSGAVDFADILIVIGAWGACP